MKNVPVGYRWCNQGHSGSQSIVVEKCTVELWLDQELAWLENGREEEKCICAHKRSMAQAYVGEQGSTNICAKELWSDQEYAQVGA